jgi:hypothetical protein
MIKIVGKERGWCWFCSKMKMLLVVSMWNDEGDELEEMVCEECWSKDDWKESV